MILISILIAVTLLFLFYLWLDYFMKRKKKKLEEEYLKKLEEEKNGRGTEGSGDIGTTNPVIGE